MKRPVITKEMILQAAKNIATDDVIALDNMNKEVREMHRKACIAWAKDNDIQPPFPIGTMTTKGEITGISEYHAASYLVKENGQKNETRRLIVKFEDAIQAGSRYSAKHCAIQP